MLLLLLLLLLPVLVVPQFEAECQTLRSSLITVESKCHAAQSQVAQLKEKMASLDHVLRVSLPPLFLASISLLYWFLGSLVFLVPWFLALLDTGRLVSNSYLHIGVAANARSGREEEEHGEGARRVGQQPSDGTGPAGSLGQLEER